MTDTLLPFQPRGQWLRQRRQELNLTSPVVAKALGLTSYFGTIEVYDLFIPPAWGKVLAGLGITEVDTWEEADTGLRGAALRGWRNAVFVQAHHLADALGVHEVALLLVESRDWPVPPEWQPVLLELFAVAPAPTKRKKPSWGVRDRAVPRVREGQSVEAVAESIGMEPEVVRLWVRLAEILEARRGGGGVVADAPEVQVDRAPTAEQAQESATPPATGSAEVAAPAPGDPEVILKVSLRKSQLRALNLLAQVFPERSASELAGVVVAKFLRDQREIVQGLERLVELGSGDPNRFDDPAEG